MPDETPRRNGKLIFMRGSAGLGGDGITEVTVQSDVVILSQVQVDGRIEAWSLSRNGKQLGVIKAEHAIGWIDGTAIIWPEKKEDK